MEYKSMMHVAFYTARMEEMIDFYTRQMGGQVKVVMRYESYLERDDRPELQALAKKDPQRLFYVYIELAPLQCIELFEARPDQKPLAGFNEQVGYSHFALLVDDIFAARKELEHRGVTFTTQISKGPSETYQMWCHDPDDNYFEIMQFTENSVQIKGMK